MTTRSLADFQFDFGRCLGSADLAGAAKVAADCRADWPGDRSGWLFGSIVALLAGNKAHALALIAEWLAADPSDVQCLLQKAECLLALGDRAAALKAADRAAQGAKEVLALDAVGKFLAHAEDHQGALEAFDRALGIAPDHPVLRAARADAHRILGNLDLAAADYEKVLETQPTAAKALHALVGLRRQSGEHHRVPQLQAALARASDGSPEAAILHFALAKSLDDLGDHAASWEHLRAGNAMERARLQYSAADDRSVIDQTIDAFANVETPRPDTTGERPVFIVGLPRSGSTLVERIIGSHSKVHSAGELTVLPEAIDAAIRRFAEPQTLDRDRYIAAQRDVDPGVIAQEYLARVVDLRGGRERFTDKLLTNFLHCALILRAFPAAHIVHVTRHPLAACYAIYRTRFAGTHTFAYDLKEIGEFYAGYHKIMAHWHRVLPGRILTVAYEDVVKALEPTTRRLLDALELPFEAACLDFQRNPAPVKTTSMVQVRQPLYDSALHQWHNYAPQLAPLRSFLESASITVE